MAAPDRERRDRKLRKASAAGSGSISDPFAAVLLERYGRERHEHGETAVPSESAPLPRRLGKYELLEEIGRGGMGVIYRAREVGLERPVAIKMILSGPLATDSEVRRFREEALATARLAHPGIVPILDTGHLDGWWFIAMRLLDGGSLAARIERYRGRPREAARLVEALARTIHFAHQRGVIHRDLKPENVLFDGDGRPHIADFGLSKRIDAGEGLTRSGLVLGTLAYMAPEQTTGRRSATTTAADIYALGAILYELVTGSPPFHGSETAELLGRILTDEPPAPSRIEVSVPRDVDTICLKCLEKEPERRYGSAGELADDLGRFLRDEPLAAHPSGVVTRVVKWTRRRPAAAVLVIVAALLLLGAPAAVLWHNARLVERAAAEARQAALGRRYVHAARLNLAFEAWRRHLHGRTRDLLESLRPAAGHEDLRDFGWRHLGRIAMPERLSIEAHSARIDGLRLVDEGRRVMTAGLHGGVRVWNVAGGELAADSPAEEEPILFPCVSRDGRFVAQMRKRPAAGSWGLRVVERISRGRTTVWRTRVLSRETGFQAAGFSPAGDVLLAADAAGTVFRWSTSSWRRERLARVPAPAFNLVFSPAGDRVVFCDPLGVVRVADAATFEIVARAESAAGYTSHLTFSPRGDLLAALRRDGGVDLIRTSDWTRASDLALTGNGALVFSPAGDTLAAAVVTEDEIAAVELWDTGTLSRRRRLISHDRRLSAITFGRDGTTLATADEGGVVKYWNLADPDEPVRVERPEETYFGVAVGRDGTTVVARRRDFGLDIFALERRGRALVPALRGSVRWDAGRTAEALSPDGRLAAIALENGPVTVYRIDLESAAPAATEATAIPGSDSGIVALSFSPDGDALVGASREGRVSIWRHRRGLPGASPVLESEIDTDARDASDLALSPDGATLAVGRERRPVVSLWDVASGRRLADLAAHRRWVVAFAYTADSRRLATGALDALICIWDLAAIRRQALEAREPVAAAPIRTLKGHAKAVAALVFLPGDALLATGSDDRTIKLWDLVTGEERATLTGHRLHVNALAVAPGRDILISAGGRKRAYGDIILWSGERESEDDARHAR